MPPEVVAQILDDLDQGEKVIDSLRTAAHLIAEAREDSLGLKLVESAAYNLREALDAVVVGEDGGAGGMPAIRDAYERFHLASSGPEADEASGLRMLASEIGRLAAEGSLHNYRTRQFLAWLKTRTGIAPLPGDDDPIIQHARLRKQVNKTLHSTGTLPVLAGLYDEAIAWFVRLFTPPDDRVQQIVELARTSLTDPSQVRTLRAEIAFNAHHLGRFLAEVRDPSWLDALFEDGLIHPPRNDEPWPVTSLINGNGGIPAHCIVDLLRRVRVSTSGAGADVVLHLDRNLIQLCLRIGQPSHGLVAEIVARHPNDHWVQRIAVYIAKEAGPDSSIVVTVANSVIDTDTTADTPYQTRTIADLLTSGITSENARERMGLLAAKLAKLAEGPRLRISPPDIASLNTPDGADDLRDEALIVTERFVNAIEHWREANLPTSELASMVAPIAGELGERIMCRVLTGADDVTRETKIAHLSSRLSSPTASGDDRDLIADLGPLTDVEIRLLASAFGTPSPSPQPDPEGNVDPPPDWARAWRWSMVLPASVLTSWETAIAAVTKLHGSPDAGSLSRRIPRVLSARPESPYRTEDLAALSPIDAAERVSAWRLKPSDGFWGSGTYELGSALEAAITADVQAWTIDPIAVVTALREPAYIQRYFHVIERNAKTLTGSVGPIMAAVALIRTEPWTPARITHSESDPDVSWEALQRPTVELVGAFANAEADFGTHLDLAWQLTIELVRALPEDFPPLDEPKDHESHNDVYARAINRAYGEALKTAVSLGWLGHRRDGVTPMEFIELLDFVLTVPGSVGAELRSILAAFRPVLEHSARDWLVRRHKDLFGGELGTVTFHATLKYPRPTTWLYEVYRTRIATAALEGVPNAVALPLIGYLWEIDRFTIPRILGGYHCDADVLQRTAGEIASLAQDLTADDPMLALALAFWDGMLEGAGSTVPVEALSGAGRWVFVDAVSIDELIPRLDRTVTLTGGEIDLATEVADRCRDAQPNEAGLRILRLMQGHGEPWEKDHVGRAGVEALISAAGNGLGGGFNRLRARLIELGFHAAADVDQEPT